MPRIIQHEIMNKIISYNILYHILYIFIHDERYVVYHLFIILTMMQYNIGLVNL